MCSYCIGYGTTVHQLSNLVMDTGAVKYVKRKIIRANDTFSPCTHVSEDMRVIRGQFSAAHHSEHTSTHFSFATF